MTDHGRTLLRTYISQRYEMGEREWCIDADALTALFAPADTGAHGENSQPSSPHTRNENHDARSLSAEARERTAMTAAGHATDKSPDAGDVVHTPLDFPMIGQSDTLAGLDATVRDCLRCSLGTTRNCFVFGEGDPDADIMFIGEAPGADEDMQGRPFVGRAGQLLTKMIESIKLRREDVFIANILKCRPPGNRDPKPDEIAQCESILLRQIELIKPRVICALGRISGQTLLRSKATLGALRGQVHDYHGVKLIVTYHPAALLRNPNWKRPAWDDLKFLRREYDGLEL